MALCCQLLLAYLTRRMSAQPVRQAVSDLEREAARLQVILDFLSSAYLWLASKRGLCVQDNAQAIGDIQRSLVTIASAWHACLDNAAARQAS